MTLNVAIIQINSSEDVLQNIQVIEDLCAESCIKEVDLICLPECTFYRHQGKSAMQMYAITDAYVEWFCAQAKKLKKWILIGSFFEKGEKGKGYNTSVLINTEGKIQSQYQKIHLFNVTLDDGRVMKESRQFHAGVEPVMTTIKGFNCGLSICFDCRFPELYRYYAQKGCHVLFIPSSFTTETGGKHWHILCRARAIETQSYVIAPNQFGKGANGKDTYGHSMIVNPLGEILAEASSDKAEVITATLDVKNVLALRKRFPVLHKQQWRKKE